ncbi:hypothetical protein ACFL20_08030 [Spirochaetota bacterium]
MNDGTHIVTPFGVKWKVASATEVILVVLVIVVLILIFFVLIRYMVKLKNQKILDYELFIFKLKRKELSNFQIKLINSIVNMLRLPKPATLLNDPKLFESIIGKFLLYLQTKDEKEDSLFSICKELTVIYEKLYLSTSFRKVLDSMEEIEDGHLIYFIDSDEDVYLGKIIGKDSNDMDIHLFRNPKKLDKFEEEKQVKVHIWRSGDGEYSFKSKTIGIDNNILKIVTPKEFEREKEFRRPYVDAIIPAVIIDTTDGPENESSAVNGTINKLNDYEMIIRLEEGLDYRKRYFVKFEMYKFKMIVTAKVLSNKIIKEDRVFYYTFKILEMSDPANAVLKKFIYEHL